MPTRMRRFSSLREGLEKRLPPARRMLPEDEWKRPLTEYEKSGLIQKAFARREGGSVHTLVACLGRVRKRSTPDRANQPIRFREVSLPASDLLFWR
jgi:hypothetical protein